VAQKSLGYVQLEWTCPNCSTKNPGPQKTCLSCGMPQPDTVQFEQAAQEQIITDEAAIAAAEAGPDIHCHYCGTRNQANAATCSQCGANLAEGDKRAAGKVLGAHRDQPAKPIACPSCGAENAPDAPKCAQCGASLVAPPKMPPPTGTTAKPARSAAMVIGLVVAGLLLCAAAITCVVMLNRTENLTGTVSGVEWRRTIEIEQLKPVTHEAWHDQIPAGATPGSCVSKVRRTEDNPTANSREVCGTPYTVDKGSGYGKVVQDCKYEVSEDYCKYTVREWQQVDEAVQKGSDQSPRWPALKLTANQREGSRSETYTCHFRTENGQLDYSGSDAKLLTRCQPGSKWVLKVNTFNAVTGLEPAK